MPDPERANQNDQSVSERERREDSPLIEDSQAGTDAGESTPRPATPPLPVVNREEDQENQRGSRKRFRGEDSIRENRSPAGVPTPSEHRPPTLGRFQGPAVAPQPFQRPPRPFPAPSPPTNQHLFNEWQPPHSFHQSFHQPTQRPPFQTTNVDSLADELGRTLHLFQGSIGRIHHTIQALQSFSAGIYEATSFPPPRPYWRPYQPPPVPHRPLLERFAPEPPVRFIAGPSAPGPSRLPDSCPPSFPRTLAPLPRSKKSELNRKRRERKKRVTASHKGKERDEEETGDEADKENEEGDK